jgi:hypothetical protein
MRQLEEANKWKAEPITSGVTFKSYITDMKNALSNYRGIGLVLGIGVIALLIGCTLLIWGGFTGATRYARRSLPRQLDWVSDKIKGWDKPIPVEPDTTSPFYHSD